MTFAGPSLAPHGHTVQAALATAARELSNVSESPRIDAHILLAHALRCERTWLISHPEFKLSKAQSETFAGLLEERASGMPLAYITHTWGFFGREFEVTSDVLVPRPETERLVERAIAHLRSRDGPTTVLDVGTGSGIIACTIAAECPDALVDATDISEKALAVAARNARRLRVESRCAFHLGELAAPVEGKKFDCILANLPYVPAAQIPGRPHGLAFEPMVALDGGLDGLACYRSLLTDLDAYARAGCLILLEASAPAIDGLFQLSKRVFPSALVAVERDYAGLDRFVSIRSPGGKGGRRAE
ncbi:MAG: peptide chain release factor N(5)-glutamine methyltransferase [Candidatus Meridianibacter frigidus]|nr:MAG: peptide chain release factor N(5)-glutamine methyltransferase [Candidatus Eremiobacteraeota bacterium]